MNEVFIRKQVRLKRDELYKEYKLYDDELKRLESKKWSRWFKKQKEKI
jgi:hypothetical protein